MNLGLEGKIVLIAGGSRGIGLATAKLFASEGAKVCICARDKEQLRIAVEEVANETGVSIKGYRADVIDKEDLSNLFRAIAQDFGRLDVLVNNVGSGVYKPFLDVTEEDLQRIMNINFFSHFRLTQCAVPVMRGQGGGSVVNVAGSSGVTLLDPPFNSACTAASKAADVRFTKSLAMELGPENIRVNCVAPSFVVVLERLERWQKSMGAASLTNEQLQATWGARITLPGHRWCTREEVAKTIAFVASPAASYINGSILVVDGGLSRT